MRTRTAVAGLALLGVGSSVLTGTILGQTFQKKRQAPAAAAAAAPGVPYQSPRWSRLTGVDVGVDANGRVTVAANVSLYDEMQGSDYLWGVIVRNADDPADVTARHYTEQTFRPAPGAAEKPTFRDAFGMPPGRYWVEVRLYRIARGTPAAVVEALKRVGPEHGWVSLSASRLVVVPG